MRMNHVMQHAHFTNMNMKTRNAARLYPRHANVPDYVDLLALRVASLFLVVPRESRATDGRCTYGFRGRRGDFKVWSINS